MKRNNWYHYLLGGCICILLFIYLSYILNPYLTKYFFSKGKIYNFVGVNITFFILLLSLLAVSYSIHGLNLKLLITDRSRISPKRIIRGFLIWFAVLLIFLIIGLFTKPHLYRMEKNIIDVFPFLFLSMVLTPIQITVEELIFRSYLLKGLKSVKKNSVFIILVSSGIFALLHMKNPEVKEDIVLYFLTYFFMAALLGYLAIKYRGLEYSLGIHFANNFFAIVFLNYKDSPLPTTPLFFTEETSPRISLITFFITALITLFTIKQLERKDDKKHNI